MKVWIASIVVAYLLGSIPFGYLLVRIFRRQDIRTQGSGNIGATNVLRSGAKGLGIATLLLDLGKALAAVLIARRLASGMGAQAYEIAMAAAMAAVAGHVFPIWLGLRGGKGVASALGVLLALTWPTALCVLAIFVVIVALTRYVSLASIAAAAMVPVVGFFFLPVRTPFTIVGLVFLAALVIAKHHANIGRLLAGTESRFGTGAQAAGKAGA